MDTRLLRYLFSGKIEKQYNSLLNIENFNFASENHHYFNIYIPVRQLIIETIDETIIILDEYNSYGLIYYAPKFFNTLILDVENQYSIPAIIDDKTCILDFTFTKEFYYGVMRYFLRDLTITQTNNDGAISLFNYYDYTETNYNNIKKIIQKNGAQVFISDFMHGLYTNENRIIYNLLDEELLRKANNLLSNINNIGYEDF